MKDKVFMSYHGKRIWYNVDKKGTVYYMVTKGDGTDEYFTSWEYACEWIDKKYKK